MTVKTSGTFKCVGTTVIDYCAYCSDSGHTMATYIFALLALSAVLTQQSEDTTMKLRNYTEAHLTSLFSNKGQVARWHVIVVLWLSSSCSLTKVLNQLTKLMSFEKFAGNVSKFLSLYANGSTCSIWRQYISVLVWKINVFCYLFKVKKNRI